MSYLIPNIFVVIIMSFVSGDFERLTQTLEEFKDNSVGLSTAVKELQNAIESNKLNTEQLAVLQGKMVEALKSLKNFDVAVDKTLKEFDTKIKELQNSQKNLSKENLDRLEELIERVKNLEKSKPDLDRLGSTLNNALNSKNAEDIKKLQKQIDEMMQNNVAKNFADNAQAADQILKQIQAFTKITRLRNGRNGQSVIFNLQLSEARNGKQIPLASRQLVVGEQILDGPFKESFTIDTDMDGIASFEASEDKRREMNKRQAFFVIKFKGDALRKDATSSKFR